METQRCIWHDSNAGAKKPTGEGMEFPLTAEYWAPHTTNKSGFMGAMCRWCKNRRMKWKRHKDIADARAEARQSTQEPVIVKQGEPTFIRPRFRANTGNVISIFR